MADKYKVYELPSGTRAIYNSSIPDEEVAKDQLRLGNLQVGEALPEGLESDSKGKLLTKGKSLTYNILEMIRPIVAPSVEAATLFAMKGRNPKLATAASLGTTAMVDKALQLAEGSEREQPFLSEILSTEKGSFADSTADTAQMVGVNAAGGAALGGLYKLGKEFARSNLPSNMLTALGIAPPATLDYLKQLSATTAQRTGSRSLQFIEDVFAPKIKKTRLDEQVDKTKILRDEKLKQLTNITDPHELGRAQQEKLNVGYTLSKMKSSQEAELAKAVANDPANVVSVPTSFAHPTLKNNLGQPLQIPGKSKEVRGPIHLRETLQNAYNNIRDVDSISKFYAPDEVDKILGFSKNLIADTNAKFDKSGNLLTSDPIDFNIAWELKKLAGRRGYGDAKTAQDKINALFKTFDSSIGEDIGNSIHSWNQGAQVAKVAWETSKKIVKSRHETYNVKDAITRIINNENRAPLDDVRKLTDDPDILQRALIAGAGQGSNAKKILQGLTLKDIFQKGWTEETSEGLARGYFDSNKLAAAWLDPDKQKSYQILFGSAHRENITKFMDAIAKTSQKLQTGGSVATKIRVASSVAYLGASAFNGDLFDSTSSRVAGAIAGGSVGLHFLAKGLMHPVAAKYITRLVAGEPLGTSERFAMKTIMGAMQGAIVTIHNQDGTSTDMTVNKEGKLTRKD